MKQNSPKILSNIFRMVQKKKKEKEAKNTKPSTRESTISNYVANLFFSFISQRIGRLITFHKSTSSPMTFILFIFSSTSFFPFM